MSGNVFLREYSEDDDANKTSIIGGDVFIGPESSEIPPAHHPSDNPQLQQMRRY